MAAVPPSVASDGSSDDQYGATLIAKSILVKPGVKKTMGIEAFGFDDDWEWN